MTYLPPMSAFHLPVLADPQPTWLPTISAQFAQTSLIDPMALSEQMRLEIANFNPTSIHQRVLQNPLLVHNVSPWKRTESNVWTQSGMMVFECTTPNPRYFTLHFDNRIIELMDAIDNSLRPK